MIRRIKRIVLYCVILFIIPANGVSALTKDEYASHLPYWIEVDLTHNLVIAYSTKDDSVVRVMICSPGLYSGWTPTGVYYLPPKERKTERGPWYKIDEDWVRYATRIKGGIMTHSIVYGRNDVSSLKKKTWSLLGTNASHGCLRMTPVDAQWIAYNCETGTKFVLHQVEESIERKELHDQIKASLPRPNADGTLGEWEPTLSPTPAPLIGRNAENYHADTYHIEALQERLQSLGFFSGPINGEYGEDTALAVMNFQEAMGYEATGVANIQLLNLLNEPDAAIGTYVSIANGDSSPVISALQEALMELGYYQGPIDGTYAEPMQAAVKNFCKDRRLDIENDIPPSIQKIILQSGSHFMGARTPKPSAQISEPNPQATPMPFEMSEQEAAESTGNSARVILDKDGSFLYLRSAESKNSKILAEMPHRAQIEILEWGEKYHRVLYEGIEGYASAKYIVPTQ